MRNTTTDLNIHADANGTPSRTMVANRNLEQIALVAIDAQLFESFLRKAPRSS